MSKRSYLKKLVAGLLSISLAVTGVFFYTPESAFALDGSSLDFKVGWLDSKGKPVDNSYHLTEIYGPSLQQDDMAVTRIDMYVDNQKKGTALNFSWIGDVANNGYIFGTLSEATQWTTIFNGNPSYVNGGGANAYGHRIYNKSTGVTHVDMKNLAEVAIASGGWGEYDHRSLYQYEPGKYRRTAKFYTTPRPTREVKTDKSVYKPTETVKITPTATDYSKYDRGIEVVNLTVINKTTGRGYYQFKDVIKFHPDTTHGAGDSFTWNNGGKPLEYKPPAGGHDPGLYEVRFLIVDSKKRSNRESSDIRVATEAIATFTVEGGPPVLGCTNINVHYGTNASAPTIGSGSTEVVSTGDAVKFFAETNGTGAKGDWKVVGYPAFNANNTAAFSFTAPNAYGETLTVTYSLPGTSEICKTFYIKINPQGSIQCPPTDSSKAEKMDIWHKYNAGSSGTLEYSLLTPHATANASIRVNVDNMNNKSEIVRIQTSSRSTGGSWFVDGAPAKSSAVELIGGGHALRISDYATAISEDDSLTFRVEYRGNDGRVWCYNITLTTQKRERPVASCFKVYDQYMGGSVIPSGETLYLTPSMAKFDFHVGYHDGYDDKQPYPVNWEVVYPDGSVHPWPWWEDDRGRMKQEETANFVYDSKLNKGLSSTYQVWFNTPGTYKIRNDAHLRMKQYQKLDCPPWEINIVIQDEPPESGCEDFSLGSIYVDGVQRKFSGGTGTPSNPYILHIEPGEDNETRITALYKGQKGVELYWRLQYKLGGLGHDASEFEYSFNDNPADVPDGYLLTASRSKTDENCFTIKIIWGDPPNFNCEDLMLRAQIDGSFTSLDGSGTQADPYRIELMTGNRYDINFYAFLKNGSGQGTTKGIDSVKWELVSSKGSNTSSTGNPYSKTFNESSKVTYTLKATIKGDDITCIKYMEIIVDEASCKDLYIQTWTSGSNSWTKQKSSDSGNIGQISHQGPLDIKVVVTTNSKEPSTDNRLRVKWTVTNETTGQTLTNQSSTPDEIFQINGLTSGRYIFKAKVIDSRYPAFLDCELTKIIVFGDKNSGCDAVYMHLVDKFGTVMSSQLVKSGSTISYPSSPDMIGLLIWDSPENALDHFGTDFIEAEWTYPPPLQNRQDDNSVFYNTNPLPEGSYTITAKIIDPDWPNAIGCTFTVTIVIGQELPKEPPPCTTCEPGGDIPGGKMNIKIYDSENRLLQSTSDGTWEKEPARIEVEIDQNRINSAFAQIDQEIAQAVVDKTAYFQAKYPAPDYEDVTIVANPSYWNGKSSPMTKWPSSVSMSVDGPGIDRNFNLNPQLRVQSHTYDGTTVPTLTTWAYQLNSQDYVVKAEPFDISVPYKIDFDVSYKKCSEKPDPDNPDAPPSKECTPGTDRESIQNTFTIKVQGDDTRFEVYEPNAKGVLLHTPEWAEKHSRDRYKNSKNNSFYAGETILTHVIFEARHKHPFSKQYPVILSATSWMQERGGKNTDLRNSLNLVKMGTEWHGPSFNVPKLGMRENGVDTPIMGDVWKGLQRGNYNVYFLPRFKFGVDKGYPVYDKTQLRGHNMDDYKVSIEILGNAYEWQGYRTHYK